MCIRLAMTTSLLSFFLFLDSCFLFLFSCITKPLYLYLVVEFACATPLIPSESEKPSTLSNERKSFLMSRIYVMCKRVVMRNEESVDIKEIASSFFLVMLTSFFSFFFSLVSFFLYYEASLPILCSWICLRHPLNSVWVGETQRTVQSKLQILLNFYVLLKLVLYS